MCCCCCCVQSHRVCRFWCCVVAGPRTNGGHLRVHANNTTHTAQRCVPLAQTQTNYHTVVLIQPTHKWKRTVRPQYIKKHLKSTPRAHHRFITVNYCYSSIGVSWKTSDRPTYTIFMCARQHIIHTHKKHSDIQAATTHTHSGHSPRTQTTLVGVKQQNGQRQLFDGIIDGSIDIGNGRSGAKRNAAWLQR